MTLAAATLCIARVAQIRIGHGQEGVIEGNGFLHEQSVFHRLVVLLTEKEYTQLKPLIVPVGIMRVQLQRLFRQAHGALRFTKLGIDQAIRGAGRHLEGASVSALANSARACVRASRDRHRPVREPGGFRHRRDRAAPPSRATSIIFDSASSTEGARPRSIKYNLDIGQPDISTCQLRIDLERLSEQSLLLRPGLPSSRCRSAAMLGFHSKEIGVIGGQITGGFRLMRDAFGLRNCPLVAGEGGCNFLGDIVLHLEQVVAGRSYRSDQTWPPDAVSISWAVTRIWSPLG